MTAFARLGAICLDAPNPGPVADFYRAFLGLDVIWESDEFVALKGAGVLITVARVDDYRPAEWPTGDVPKQMHLDLAVDDLDEAERQAVGLGATKPDRQPAPDRWRVLIDPAGHPFCVTVLLPDV